MTKKCFWRKARQNLSQFIKILLRCFSNKQQTNSASDFSAQLFKIKILNTYDSKFPTKCYQFRSKWKNIFESLTHNLNALISSDLTILSFRETVHYAFSSKPIDELQSFARIVATKCFFLLENSNRWSAIDSILTLQFALTKVTSSIFLISRQLCRIRKIILLNAIHLPHQFSLRFDHEIIC